MTIDRRSERTNGASAPDRRAGRLRGVVLPLLFGAGLGALVLGCASRSPFRQEFVELSSDHFVLTSSLTAEETKEFAYHLEVFRMGIVALLGLVDDETLPPTPVYVFDDRSLGRPFAVQHEAAFLLDEVDTPIFVFRGGRDFEARMTPDLRHRYAHRMLRDRAKSELPLWYEEGAAQLARSIDDDARGVLLGRIDPTWRNLILDWRSGDLPSALQRADLSEETAPGRIRFEALTWGIAHALEFGDGAVTGEPTRLALYREKLARSGGTAARDDALAAIGLDGDALEKLVYKHLEKKRPQVRLLELHGLKTRHWRTTALSLAESRARLAELALRLERPELALDYYERALQKDPKLPSARLGRAVAAAWLGDSEVVTSTLASMQWLPDAPSALLVAAGDAERALAAKADSPGDRRDALDAARARYAEALAGPRPDVRAALGMARTYLEIEGEDPAKAFEWLDAVRERRPGSLRLELWQARAETRTGQTRLAQVRAKNVVSRTHERAIEDAARAILEAGAAAD